MAPQIGDVASQPVVVPPDLRASLKQFQGTKYYGFLRGEKLSTKRQHQQRLLVLSTPMLAVLDSATNRVARLIYLKQIAEICATSENCVCVTIIMNDPNEPCMVLRFPPRRGAMSAKLFFNNLIYNARFAVHNYKIRFRLTNAAEVSRIFPARGKKTNGYRGPRAKLQDLKKNGGVKSVILPRDEAVEAALRSEMRARLGIQPEPIKLQEVAPVIEERKVEEYVPPVVEQEEEEESPPMYVAPPPIQYIPDPVPETVPEPYIPPSTAYDEEDASHQRKMERDARRKQRSKKKKKKDRFWREFCEVYDSLQGSSEGVSTRRSLSGGTLGTLGPSYSPITTPPPSSYRRVEGEASLASFLSAHSRSPHSSNLDSLYNTASEHPLKRRTSFKDLPYTRSVF